MFESFYRRTEICKMESSLRSKPGRVLSLWTLVLGCINISGFRPSLLSVTAESLDMVKVSAVAGGDATLACDTRSTQASDVLLLVVWYKNNVPMYSFDTRSKSPGSAHWVDEQLGGRARWHTATPSMLRIRDIIPGDRGIYRCRVDFKISPTRNHKIMLDVIELPEKPKIFDEFDKEVVGVAGPYIEDASLKLTCVVSGGKPMPRLRWWRDDKVIATLPSVDDGSRLSLLELRIPKLTRAYYEAVYTCTADNTPLAPPSRVNVQIQLYLRPLFVEILAREQPLTVGQKAELACRAVGARPMAVITWWLEERQLMTAAQKNSDDKNETVSFLRWTPRMDQDGRILTCRASHVKLEHSTIESSITLNLHYSPIVILTLGSKLDANNIKEGDDVYFECTVKSNPPAYKVVWEHNGQVMTHNQRAGVIAGSAHLALQGVNRNQAGEYACTASNVEGDGKSPAVTLQIIYKPICVTTATMIVGAAINEPANVTCEVDGFPSPHNFQWTLNNSMGSQEIEAEKFSLDGPGRSVLSYTPTTEKDYGSLTCRATNLAGQQMEPCRYSLLPAVRPEPLTNCSTVNLTDNSAEIKCTAGYDGGLLTSYFAEVWESKTLVANVSTSQPSWVVRGLGSGKTLKLVFYASNARGRSDLAELKISTLSRMALHKDGTTRDAELDSSWVLGIIAGIAGTLIVILVVTLVARRQHHRPIQYEAPLQPVKTNKNSTQTTNRSPVQPDDKNPDVVPLGKDFHSARDVDRPPEPPPYGSLISPRVGASRSSHSIHHNESRSLTPITPASDVQSIATLADDRRSVTSGTFSRRREIVTTRTPLLANTRESCV